MAAGNKLPSTMGGAAWDYLKGTNAGHLLGAESAKQEYEFLKGQRDQTKAQLDQTEQRLKQLEAIKEKNIKEEDRERKEEEKTWKQIAKNLEDARKRAIEQMKAEEKAQAKEQKEWKRLEQDAKHNAIKDTFNSILDQDSPITDAQYDWAMKTRRESATGLEANRNMQKSLADAIQKGVGKGFIEF